MNCFGQSKVVSVTHAALKSACISGLILLEHSLLEPSCHDIKKSSFNAKKRGHTEQAIKIKHLVNTEAMRRTKAPSDSLYQHARNKREVISKFSFQPNYQLDSVI